MQLITGKTKLLGIIGDPVGHSLSPVMHNAAIAHLGLDFIYVPFSVKGEKLETAIAGFEAINLVGFNITIPHKQAILPLLSNISAVARMIGAVNTVWRTETGWSGTNTDVEGFLAPLQRQSQDWTQVVPVVLGNGGAARAVVVGCAALGCPEIQIVGRDQLKLEKFKQSWDLAPLSADLKVYTGSELPHLLSQTKLLVNTTPIGMSPNIEESPLDDRLLEKLQPGAIAYDLIYTPNPTQFLKQAEKQGAMIIDGLEMLVQQGAAALQIWLQQPIPVEVMRQSLQQSLGLSQ
jgi:shikimate dehydrogenase